MPDEAELSKIGVTDPVATIKGIERQMCVGSTDGLVSSEMLISRKPLASACKGLTSKQAV